MRVRRARSNLRDWKHSADFQRVALSPCRISLPEAVSRGPHMCVIVAASRDIASRARVFVTVGETARDRHRSKTMSAEEEAQMTEEVRLASARLGARATLPSRLSCFWVCPGRPSRSPGTRASGHPASRLRDPRARAIAKIHRARTPRAASRGVSRGRRAARFFHASRVLAIMNCRPPRPRAIPSPRARTRPRSC